MGYGVPEYDDEYSFDDRAGFGSIFTDVINRVAQKGGVVPVAPRQLPSPVAPSSPTYRPPASGGGGIVAAPLPPPIVVTTGQPPAPPPVSAQTTVGPPVSPTVPGPSSGGGSSAPAYADSGGGGSGGMLANLSDAATSSVGLVLLAVVGFWALRKSGGQRRL